MHGTEQSGRELVPVVRIGHRVGDLDLYLARAAGTLTQRKPVRRPHAHALRLAIDAERRDVADAARLQRISASARVCASTSTGCPDREDQALLVRG